MERSDQPPDDKELWQDFVLKGREESFHLLVQRHKLGLFNAAYRILYDTHAAEDVVQRVFVALIERKNELANVESLQSWLYRATFNQALNMKKLRRRRKVRERAAQTPSTPETPRETAVRRELREELDLALAKLKHSLRIPLILRYLQGMSHAETGEVLGLSSEATRKRITRALKRLRKLLTGRGLLLSLVAVEEGLRTVPAKAASANFLTSTSSLLSAASAGTAASEAAIFSTALITGVTIMTAKVKITVGIIAVLALAFLLTFTLRSTHRERRAAPPPNEAPRRTTAKRETQRPRTTAPQKSADEEMPSHDELEEVPLGSISGRLIDTDGNVITNFSEPIGRPGFKLTRGEPIQDMPIHIHADGTYSVDGLPEGAYSIGPSGGGTLQLRGRYYYWNELPDNIRPGTINADIVLICANPGTIRGKVLDAETRLPITKFTVFHKYDFRSAPDRSRASYLHLSLRAGWLDYVAPLDALRRQRDTWKEKVESIERRDIESRSIIEENELYHAKSYLESFRSALEHRRLDFESQEGVFERDDYLLGKHFFTILAEGYVPKSVEIELNDSKPVDVTFLMYERGATVAGRVVDGSGNGSEDAVVEILMPTGIEYFYSWASRPAWETVTPGTDGSGEFAFENVADGAYQIRASHAAYGAMATSPLKVVDGRQQPWDLVLRMQNGSGSVWGRVTGEDGSPLAGLSLEIRSGPYCVSCQTDGDGHYAAAALPPGDYVMTAELEKPSVGRYDREYLFSLAPSEQLRYDIAMSGLATLTGSVRTPQPDSSLASSLRLILRSDRLTIRTDDHAAYRFKHLPPGRYELQVVSDTLENVKYTVNLARGETRELNINLGQHGKVAGTVIGRDGAPLAGTTIAVSSPGRELSVATDTDGCYSISHLSPGPIHVTFPKGEFAGTWHELELKTSETYRDEDKRLDIDFSLLGDVAGQISQTDGKPLELAALKIESPHRTVEATTDQEGRFRAEGLFPGQCRIHLPVPHLGQAYTFELAPKEEKELKILLPP